MRNTGGPRFGLGVSLLFLLGRLASISGGHDGGNREASKGSPGCKAVRKSVPYGAPPYSNEVSHTLAGDRKRGCDFVSQPIEILVVGGKGFEPSAFGSGGLFWPV